MKKYYYIGLAALVVGLLLSVVSWLELCDEMCQATGRWRLFGFKFQNVGLAFFPTVIALHIYGRHNPISYRLASWMIAASLGAELVFVGIQKYEIGSWCPVCLSIALTLVVAELSYFIPFLFSLNRSWQNNNKEEIMRHVRIGTTTFVIFIIGFLAAFFGSTKINPLEAAQSRIEEGIAFGNTKSVIEIYLFSDWKCPACRKLEPELPSLLAAAERLGKLTFVDVDIHPETLNYSPYNLSFMLHNKRAYLKLRDGLTEISITKNAPSASEIEAMASKYGVQYEPMNYSDVSLGMDYFRHLAAEFDINSTPAMVIVNRDTKKGKKLFGTREINVDNMTKAVNELK